MKQIDEVGLVIADTNAVAVPNAIREQLIAELGPIADRLEGYVTYANNIKVSNDAEAVDAVAMCNQILADAKLVKAHDMLTQITSGLHNLHRRWVGLRDAFVTPLEASRTTIRSKVLAWQAAEQAKAAAEQRRLQAEADEKARRERARLEAEAARLKTPGKQEARLAQAASVTAPVVMVTAPKVEMRGVSKVWKIKTFDQDVFFAALAARPDLRGYVEVEQARMERSRAANPTLEIPGVEFHQVIR